MLFLCGAADVHARRHVNRPPVHHPASSPPQVGAPTPPFALAPGWPRGLRRLLGLPVALGGREVEVEGEVANAQRLCPSVLSLCAQVPRACAEAFVARLRAAGAYTDPTRLRLNVLPSGGWCGHIFRDQAEVTRQTLAFFAETA